MCLYSFFHKRARMWIVYSMFSKMRWKQRSIHKLQSLGRCQYSCCQVFILCHQPRHTKKRVHFLSVPSLPPNQQEFCPQNPSSQLWLPAELPSAAQGCSVLPYIPPWSIPTLLSVQPSCRDALSGWLPATHITDPSPRGMSSYRQLEYSDSWLASLGIEGTSSRASGNGSLLFLFADRLQIFLQNRKL